MAAFSSSVKRVPATEAEVHKGPLMLALVIVQEVVEVDQYAFLGE